MAYEDCKKHTSRDEGFGQRRKAVTTLLRTVGTDLGYPTPVNPENPIYNMFTLLNTRLLREAYIVIVL